MPAANSGSGDSTSATVSTRAIAAGLSHSCALTRTGGIKCWGSNDHDQLRRNDQEQLDAGRRLRTEQRRGGDRHSAQELEMTALAEKVAALSASGTP